MKARRKLKKQPSFISDELVGTRVRIKTSDGNHYTGVLKPDDGSRNLSLADGHLCKRLKSGACRTCVTPAAGKDMQLPSIYIIQIEPANTPAAEESSPIGNEDVVNASSSAREVLKKSSGESTADEAPRNEAMRTKERPGEAESARGSAESHGRTKSAGAKNREGPGLHGTSAKSKKAPSKQANGKTLASTKDASRLTDVPAERKEQHGKAATPQAVGLTPNRGGNAEARPAAAVAAPATMAPARPSEAGQAAATTATRKAPATETKKGKTKGGEGRRPSIVAKDKQRPPPAHIRPEASPPKELPKPIPALNVSNIMDPRGTLTRSPHGSGTDNHILSSGTDNLSPDKMSLRENGFRIGAEGDAEGWTEAKSRRKRKESNLKGSSGRAPRSLKSQAASSGESGSGSLARGGREFDGGASAPFVEEFRIHGVAKEGCRLVAMGVWNTGVEDRCRFMWSRKRPRKPYKLISNASGKSYVPVARDTGCTLRCVCVYCPPLRAGDTKPDISSTSKTSDSESSAASDSSSDAGESSDASAEDHCDRPTPAIAGSASASANRVRILSDSQTAVAVTSVIEPAEPKILQLSVEGGPYTTHRWVAHGKYYGGYEGESLCQWYRIDHEGREFAIPNAQAAHYVPTADDIDKKLRIRYTPVRSDGRRGETVQVDGERVKIDDELYREVQEKLSQGCNGQPVVYQVLQVGDTEEECEMRITNEWISVLYKEIGSAVCEGYNAATSVTLEPGDARAFSLTLSDSVDLRFVADSLFTRDVLALTIRSFKADRVVDGCVPGLQATVIGSAGGQGLVAQTISSIGSISSIATDKTVMHSLKSRLSRVRSIFKVIQHKHNDRRASMAEMYDDEDSPPDQQTLPFSSSQVQTAQSPFEATGMSSEPISIQLPGRRSVSPGGMSDARSRQSSRDTSPYRSPYSASVGSSYSSLSEAYTSDRTSDRDSSPGRHDPYSSVMNHISML
eukprot:Rmarinus@m.27601